MNDYGSFSLSCFFHTSSLRASLSLGKKHFYKYYPVNLSFIAYGFSADLPKRDFKLLANLRVKAAEILLNRGKPNGAFYLAGYAYAVECALKACIAKRFKKASVSA